MTPLSLLSTSRIKVSLDDEEMQAEWEALQEEDSEAYEVSESDLGDYSQQLENVTTLLLFGVFALGVISGLMMARVMWGRIRV